MRVDHLTFCGYDNSLRTLWRQGKLPKVKRDFYGDVLTEDNLSSQQIKPKFYGGKDEYSNLILLSKNNIKADKNIVRFANKQAVFNYLKQFIGVRIKDREFDFNGNDYVQGVLLTLKSLGLNI